MQVIYLNCTAILLCKKWTEMTTTTTSRKKRKSCTPRNSSNGERGVWHLSRSLQALPLRPYIRAYHCSQSHHLKPLLARFHHYYARHGVIPRRTLHQSHRLQMRISHWVIARTQTLERRPCGTFHKQSKHDRTVDVLSRTQEGLSDLGHCQP